VFEELSPRSYVRLRDTAELWQLLDVREPWETAIASIDGAISIPMGEITERYPELDATRPIAVLCHSGGRSARVAAYLAEHGFARVANVSGGIDAWSIEVDPAVPRY
jgi:rhodanese-related sulfurtransferase